MYENKFKNRKYEQNHHFDKKINFFLLCLILQSRIMFQQYSGKISGIHFHSLRFSTVIISLRNLSSCSSETELQLSGKWWRYKSRKFTFKDILNPHMNFLLLKQLFIVVGSLSFTKFCYLLKQAHALLSLVQVIVQNLSTSEIFWFADPQTLTP